MAIKNKVENAIIAAVSAIVSIVLTTMIVNQTSIAPLERQIEKQNEVIIDLAKIEKYKYEIRNEFEKLKPKESQIIINLDNKLSALQISGDTLRVDTMMQKLRFWDRVKFWKKKR
jgi:hypothetical protein